MTTIVLIDNKLAIVDTVKQALSGLPHTLIHVQTLEHLIETVTSPVQCIHLFIVGLDVANDEHASLCRRIRASSWRGVPILCIANIKSAEDVARMLDSGGDDCMRLPLVAREMAARIRVLLRRSPARAVRPMLVLNRHEKTVQVLERSVALTPTEYELLETLCRTPGKHIPASILLEQVWHYPPGLGDPALVRNHVRKLRLKLENNPDRPHIVTSAHGRGYTVQPDLVKC